MFTPILLFAVAFILLGFMVVTIYEFWNVSNIETFKVILTLLYATMASFLFVLGFTSIINTILKGVS